MRIAVVGLYSSGSSAVAQSLWHLGVDMGGPPWWADDVLNSPNNHWEPTDLAPKLADWWTEPKMRLRIGRAEFVDHLRKWIEARERFGLPGVMDFGAKHPTLSLCEEYLVEAWGDDVCFIWSHRDLNTSIEKLKNRFEHFDGHESYAQQELWNNLQLLCRRRKVHIVLWEDLKTDPRQVILQLASLLSNPPTDSQIDAAVSCIRQK